MPRPKKPRHCRQYDGDLIFKPRSIPMSRLETIALELDELEAMRLCDHDGLDQTETGRRMGVSRGTVQRLLRSGRSKVLAALLSNAALIIGQGENRATVHSDRG
ncbi:MAG: DUF134 domain-containing protein [Candidatus Palauibacterales bacterium]|jgi:uncharacterized protein|nr:DUF134 domain-containing protein [Candidatus Palauibacterales bacterium]